MNKNTIGWAIDQMIGGAKVARQNWNGRGMFLFYVPSWGQMPQTELAKKEWSGGRVPFEAYIALKTRLGSVVVWTCSQTDLLASDWEVVN